MRPVADFEFPAEQEAVLRRARRLERWSIAYLLSAAAALYLVMGDSQAMRTTLLEDLVTLVPPIAFLVSSRIATRTPTERFPYGYHSAVSIGYLTSALAILAMGLFLLIEASIALAWGERTTIGGFTLFGHTFWAGWPMLAALAYTGVPNYFLGRVKLRLAPQIHDKVLFADARMCKADWMAEAATAAGVIGTGFGIWWADAAAAALVSIDILKDGAVNIGAALTDLMDEMPKRTDGSGPDPVPGEVRNYLASLDWVAAAQVRMREEGHVFFGEAFVVPRTTDRLPERLRDAAEGARALNWRVHELTIMPVPSLSSGNEDAGLGSRTSCEPAPLRPAAPSPAVPE